MSNWIVLARASNWSMFDSDARTTQSSSVGGSAEPAMAASFSNWALTSSRAATSILENSYGFGDDCGKPK